MMVLTEMSTSITY